MILKQVSEVIWRYYQEGRVKATARKFTEADIQQMVMMAFSNRMRQLYYENQKMNEGNESYFYAPVLTTKRFDLSDPDARGMRRADMSKFDLYRLPHNKHITNTIPVGTGCKGNDGSMEITQVQPSEENFYLSPEFSSFKFFTIKGRGVNTYNLPTCIKQLDIEATFATDDVDISLDIAFDISNEILGLTLKINQFPVKIIDNSYNPNASELKRRLEDTQNAQI